MNPEFSVTDEVRNSNKVVNMIETVPCDTETVVKNYRKLFTRGSSLTKEFLERVQKNEITHKKKHLCGYEYEIKHISMLAGLIILFCCSFVGFVMMWCTNIFDEHVKSFLVLKNDSESFNSWRKPSTNPFLRVHLFNYTNVDKYLTGEDTKLKVEDCGPYTFLETVERFNTVFNNDSTLTYQERVTYEFSPEKSKGRQYDRVIVPNMPVLSAIATAKDAGIMVKFSLNSLLTTLNSKAFLNLPADRFIWGYYDTFFSVIKTILIFEKTLPFDEFGLWAHKNGTSSNKITIKTGENDVNTIGTIIKINEETSMGHWSTKECNRMDGTDGSFFGPDVIRAKQPVNIFHRDLCRKLPFHFHKEHTILGAATSYRYVPPSTVFAHPDVEPNNQCYCNLDEGECPPHGIFNATPCAFGPAYLSFPHFLHGDPALREHFIGLNPDEEKHITYLDIHPTLGFTMAGVTRLQINLLIKQAPGINAEPQSRMLPDGIMLPVAWFDVGLDAESLPKSVVDVIYRTSFTVPRIENSLKYGCLFLVLLTAFGIVMLIRGRISTKISGRRLERNISGLDALIQ